MCSVQSTCRCPRHTVIFLRFRRNIQYHTHIMETLIQPRILKGFRDFLPEAEIARTALIEKLTETFRAFGFVPIDTPVLEYADILLRKSSGETEKQVFRFTDNGGRDVALRFDLTVPFARFAAMHKDELYVPFKRYHIAKVWRGEKPQAGRYREFMQCDFDSVGSDSAASDFDILLLMKTALANIGADAVTIRVNHRGVFNRFLSRIGAREHSEEILRTVDKLAKIGADEVKAQLAAITQSEQKASDILTYIAGGARFSDTLALMQELAGGPAEDTQRLAELYAMMRETGIEQTFVLDPSITRGLDYYTGIVYETFLNDLPSIGSVCSGGRYDNLAGLYMKEKLSGVGSSIGLDRLIAALEELGSLKTKKSYLDAEILCLDASLAVHYQKTAAQLRALGISCEVFPDAKKTGQQYAYAEKKGIPYAVLIQKPDAEADRMSVKSLETRAQTDDLTAAEAAALIRGGA